MSRRSNQTYICRQLDELARQLIRAPADRRTAQVRRAERLHDELEPDATYPFDYLVYRITGFRAERDETVLLVGRAVAADLRLLIDTLSRSVRIEPTADEQLQPVPALARHLGVSTKTIERWRKGGLRWRWTFDPARERSVIAVSQRALDAFDARHPGRIDQARGFSRLDDRQRDQLVAEARAMAQQNPQISLNRVAQRLARRLDRAHETIRLILEHHDAANPDAAIFADRTGPLTERDGRLIDRARRRGVTVKRLAAYLGKSPSTVRAAQARYRLARLRERDLTGIHSPLFDRPDADQVYLHSPRAMRADQEPGTTPSVPAQGLPPQLQATYRQPVLDAATQRHLFRRMHYLRYKARTLRDRLPTSQPRFGAMDQVRALAEHARQTRQRLIRANLPVVLSVAQRHRLGSESAGARLIDLLEAGNDELFNAAETFDPFHGQGRAFDAFLTNRLLRRFTRLQQSAGDRPRARRREDARQMLGRLRDAAQARGIELFANDP